MPPGQADIGDYYRSAIESIAREVASITEAQAINNNTEDWANQLREKWGMNLIEVDSSREEELEELHGEPRAQLRYKVPVIPTDTLDVIFKYSLGANSRSPSYDSSVIKHDPSGGWLYIDTTGTPEQVRWSKQQLENQIKWWNHDIGVQNEHFLARIKEIIITRKSSIESKNKNLAEVSSQTGIKLRKKADAADIVPVPLQVKKVIGPLLQKEDPKKKLSLSSEAVVGILELMDKQCRQFERTPTVFSRLYEEDLRDIILSSLNAVFDGAAVGEAFQGLGKADIHLVISEGEIFIAETKIWGGVNSLQEATSQLLERLTWHESYGAVVIFSKNADFGEVRHSISEEIPRIGGSLGGVKQIVENHLVARFSLPSDRSKVVDVHFLVYNLYTPRPSGRSSRQP